MPDPNPNQEKAFARYWGALSALQGQMPDLKLHEPGRLIRAAAVLEEVFEDLDRTGCDRCGRTDTELAWLQACEADGQDEDARVCKGGCRG